MQQELVILTSSPIPLGAEFIPPRSAQAPPESSSPLPSPTELLKSSQARRTSPFFGDGRKATESPTRGNAVPTRKLNKAKATRKKGSTKEDVALKQDIRKENAAISRQVGTNYSEGIRWAEVKTVESEAALSNAGPPKSKTSAAKKRKPAAKKGKEKVKDASALESKETKNVTELNTGDAENINPEPYTALRRRRDWTPPKDTLLETASQNGKDLGTSSRHSSPTKKEGFTMFLEDFSCNDDSMGKKAEFVAQKSTTALKRKRIEMISVGSVNIPAAMMPPVKTNTKKKKSPEKRHRTITSHATEKFRAKDVQENDTEPEAEFFAPHTDGQATNKKRRSSGKKCEAKTSKAKTKKSTQFVSQKLLSPETAALKWQRQDIIFGTSSQLALLESTAYLRDLQLALQKSETLEEGPHQRRKSPPRIQGSRFKSSSKGLWSAGAICSDDNPFNWETTGNIGKSGFPEVADAVEANLAHDPQAVSRLSETSNQEWKHIDDFDSPPDRKSGGNAKLPILIHSSNSVSDNLCQKATIFSETQNTVTTSATSFAAPKTQTPWYDVSQLDDNTGPLDVTASRPSRKHTSTKPAATVVQPEKTHATKTETKRPRGRPRKPSTAEEESSKPRSRAKTRAKEKGKEKVIEPKPAIPHQPKVPLTPKKSRHSEEWLDIDEIHDPEPDHTPSPPRSSGYKLGELPLSTEAARRPQRKTHKSPRKRPAWDEVRDDVFAEITRLVRSDQPLAQDPHGLSWWGRMLLYDPVDVDALTEWLVGEGFAIEGAGEGGARAGFRLAGWMVKKWCDGEGVCCFLQADSWGRRRK